MKTLVTLAVMLSASAAMAYGPTYQCGDLGTLLNNTMASSRTLSIDTPNAQGGYGVLNLEIALTDANTSITRIDMTCTVSDDGNSTDYTAQDCTAGATCTSTDSGIWQKASPGTKNWAWRVDMNGFPDIECVFSVGTGAGAAADTIVVKGRLCAS